MVDLTKTVRIELNRVGAAGDVQLELRDLARRTELETKLLDLSAARELRRLLEICAPEAAPPETALAETAPPATAPPEAAPAWNVTNTQILTLEPESALRLAQEAAPNLTDTQKLAPSPTALDCTIYDGGALRDFAQKLVIGGTEPSEAAITTSVSADAASRPAPPRAPGARFTRWSAQFTRWSAQFTRWSARFQQVPRARKLILALLPLALATSLVGMHARYRTRATAPAALHATPRSVVRTALPEAIASSGTAISVPESPNSEPTPREPSSLSAAQTSPPPERTPNPKDAALAHAALRAAFDGNAREAIAAYERLGQGPAGEPFRLAARLVRDNRVRKP